MIRKRQNRSNSLKIGSNVMLSNFGLARAIEFSKDEKKINLVPIICYALIAGMSLWILKNVWGS
jgi:hypothetical protein